jgi:hypothetical protein
MRRGIGRLRAGGSFNAASLFASGQQGVLLNPFDLSTVFQDSGGTTPGANGQPIGKILDQSGRGNHFVQTTTTSRPVATSGMQADGIDDFLVSSANVDMSASDKLVLCMSVQKARTAAEAYYELSTQWSNSANLGVHALFQDNGASQQFYCASRGSAAFSSSQIAAVTSGAPAPGTYVVTAIHDIAGSSSILRINGAQVGSSAFSQGTGNFGSFLAYMFSRAGTSFFAQATIGRVFIRGGTIAAADLANVERWVGAAVGIVL